MFTHSLSWLMSFAAVPGLPSNIVLGAALPRTRFRPLSSAPGGFHIGVHGVLQIIRQACSVGPSHMQTSMHSCYCRSEPDGELLYILPNALTAQSMAEGPQGVAKAPVPPCIMAVDGNTTQISLEVDDRSAHILFMPSATFDTGASGMSRDIRGDPLVLCKALWLDLQALRQSGGASAVSA